MITIATHTTQPSNERSTQDGEDARRDDAPAQQDQLPVRTAHAEGESNITFFEGHRVEAGIPFDMRRVISIGTARSNDIIGQMTVAEAVEFVRSAKSKRDVDDALQWSARIQSELLSLIGGFEKKGNFDFDRTVCLQDLWRDQKKSLTQELTHLLKERNELDEQGIERTLKAIAWRHAKAMRLSAFMWAGKFGVRNNGSILTSTGLMCVDLDKLKLDIQALVAALKADRLVFWAALSPSKTGVKLLVRIPDDAALNEKKYLACFETFERRVASKYPGVSVSVDKQAKAVAQLCFFMHDPDSFCKPDSYILHPDEDLAGRHVEGPKAKQEKRVNASGPAADAKAGSQQKKGSEPRQPVRESRGFLFDAYPPQKQWDTVRSAVESLEDWLADLPAGKGARNLHWTRIGYAFGAWFKKLEDASIRDEASAWLLELAGQHYAGNEGCVERAMEGSDGTCGLGTLFQLAREMGDWTPPWVAERAEGGQVKKWAIIDHVIDFQSCVPPMKCVGDRWYAGENGLWKQVEQEIYQPIALDLLPCHLKSSKRVAEVMATFQKQQQVPRQLLKTACIWEDEDQRSVLINCRNGLLRVTATSVRLMPHDPNAHCFTGQLAAAYDPNAGDDTFERVFVEAQPDERAQNLLYWWFGYVLYPSLRFRLSLVNYGPSTTGKSTIWEKGIGAAIGNGLKKNLSLSDICSTTGYSIPSLQHALLNVGGELDADELGQSSRFKLLAEGGPLEVRMIYGRPYTMTDYVVKLVFLTNHLPRFRSGTDAELNRIQFICWDKVPAKPDPRLLEMVANERDGVFTQWMVPALQSILDGVKPLPDELLIRSQFAVRNDPMKVFIEKCCVLDPDATIEKNRFRRTFAYFVDQADLSGGLKDDGVCGRLLLERTYGKVKVARPRREGSREQVYAGIKLNPDFEREYAEHVGSSKPYPEY